MSVKGLEGKRVVGIIIARMGSTRVPGKSLLALAGRPVLGHMIDIARAIRGLDDICIATSDLPIDDPIARLAAAENIECVRGDAERVLDRVHSAVIATSADIVVYIGGDCPLLDPAIIDQALADYASNPCDYLNNYEPPTFPEGFDVNIVARSAVEQAFREALAPSQRVHAFSYLTRHPELFRIRNFAGAADLSSHHWSLDFPEDFDFLQAVYDRLYKPGRPIGMQDVVDCLDKEPRIAELDIRLQRGPVKHAFWNSPGILRDMANDVFELADRGKKAMLAGERYLARRCYSELRPILDELLRYFAETGAPR